VDSSAGRAVSWREPATVYLWVERKQIPHLRVMGRNIQFFEIGVLIQFWAKKMDFGTRWNVEVV
jgi:hypothetical protein